jgi:hypothetical protein
MQASVVELTHLFDIFPETRRLLARNQRMARRLHASGHGQTVAGEHTLISATTGTGVSKE